MKEYSEYQEQRFNGGELYTVTMLSGERRARMRLDSGMATGFTMGNTWTWEDPLPWQNAHYHKGLSESYLLVKGWVIFYALESGIEASQNSEYQLSVLTEDSDVRIKIFPPGVPHIVLVGPESVINATSWGTAIGNGEKKGMDWWPCEELNKFVLHTSVDELKKIITH